MQNGYIDRFEIESLSFHPKMGNGYYFLNDSERESYRLQRLS